MAAQGRATSKAVSTPIPISYQGQVAQSVLVSKEIIQFFSIDAVLIDAGAAGVNAGTIVGPFANKAGYNAKSFAASWIWNETRTGSIYIQL